MKTMIARSGYDDQPYRRQDAYCYLYASRLLSFGTIAYVFSHVTVLGFGDHCQKVTPSVAIATGHSGRSPLHDACYVHSLSQ